MATLGYHLQMCKAVFGSDSPATAFLEQKIKDSPNGENEEVVADDRQVVYLCAALHTEGRTDLFKEIKWTS